MRRARLPLSAALGAAAQIVPIYMYMETPDHSPSFTAAICAPRLYTKNMKTTSEPQIATFICAQQASTPTKGGVIGATSLPPTSVDYCR